MFLEMATTAGALTGAYVAGIISTRWLYLIFGAILIVSAVAMLRKRREIAGRNVPPDALADRLRLHGSYYDEAVG